MLLSMTAMNFVALRHLQLAETSAIQFAAPILVTVISVPLLGEKLDPRRWTAVLAGFIGVLLIVRPGTGGFHPAMLLALGNAVLYAFFNLLTRQLARSESPEATQFLSGLGPVVMMAPFALADWKPLDSWQAWAVVVLAGFSGGFGHYFNALAHRFAPASVLAPYLYLQIIYMMTLGYLIFGDVPDPAVIAGAAVVIASGLYLFDYERRGRAR
jgi:drug/metabolite transporter (DMT)-like permease